MLQIVQQLTHRQESSLSRPGNRFPSLSRQLAGLFEPSGVAFAMAMRAAKSDLEKDGNINENCVCEPGTFC